MGMTYLQLHHSYLDVTRKLTDAEFGKLVRALARYSMNQGDRPKVLPKLEMIYDMMCDQIDRERELYSRKAEAARINGAKGGRPRKPKETDSETQETQGKTHETDTITHDANISSNNNKQNNYDDDDDIRVRVRGWMEAAFCREVTGEEVASVADPAVTYCLEYLLVEELIERAARYGAKNPAPYIRKMMADAAQEHIRTLAEYERWVYLHDVFEGKVDLAAMSGEEAWVTMRREREERRSRYAPT